MTYWCRVCHVALIDEWPHRECYEHLGVGEDSVTHLDHNIEGMKIKCGKFFSTVKDGRCLNCGCEVRLSQINDGVLTTGLEKSEAL